MSETIFITGVSGFIGRHIAKEALNRGYNVSGMDSVEFPIDGVKFYKGSVLDKSEVERAMEGADYVIHLAAITSNVPFRKVLEGCYNINVTGFINVIDAAAKFKVKKFLYASSSAVYLDGFSEETTIDIKKQNNHYAKTKLINELIAASYSDIYSNMKTIGLRFFNVYGPTGEKKGDTANIINMFVKAKRDGKPIVIYGDGKQTRDFIYIDDLVNITLKILESGTDDVYNVGSGKSYSFEQIANIIAPKNKQYIPNPIPEGQYQMLTNANTKRTLSLFGGKYKFVDIKEGIAKSDFIRIGVLSIAKPEPIVGLDYSEYPTNLAKNLQLFINGEADQIYALGESKQNDLSGLAYVHTLFKNKVKGLAKKEYDIIHITNQELGFAARILKDAGVKAKVVTTIHDSVRLEGGYHTGALQSVYNKIITSSIKDALDYSDYIIFDSEQTFRSIASKFDVKKPWRAIPLGISDNVRRRKWTPREENGHFNTGYIGPLSQRHNPRFILKTAEIGSGDTLFQIYGHGMEQADLIKYKVEKGLENVVFNDYRSMPGVADVYAELDAFMYPSLHEGFGVPIVEAQAAGLPVIIYKHGKIPQEVRRYCLEAEDEKHAAQLLQDLKEKGYDSKQRKKAMEHAREFTWERTARETLDVYKELVG